MRVLVESLGEKKSENRKKIWTELEGDVIYEDKRKIVVDFGVFKECIMKLDPDYTITRLK